jgi:hypothetical protein
VPGKLPRFPNDRGSARHVIDPQRVDFGIEAELVRIQGSFRVLGRCGVVVYWCCGVVVANFRCAISPKSNPIKARPL